MANNEELSFEYQIALLAPNGQWTLYAQQLVGDGYDSPNPFDFYVADVHSDGSVELLDQDVVDGHDFVFTDGIDWEGLIRYAAEEYSPECSTFNVFNTQFEYCEVLDADDVAEQFQDAGIM